MDIQIQLTLQPINRAITMPLELDGVAGAWVGFRGVVRGTESGQPIIALEYEAYDSMAVSVMRQIAQDLRQTHSFQAFRAIHRLGIVPVGEAAIYVGVAAKHRGAAFAMLAAFMDRLKMDVPIWKTRAITAPILH